MASEPKLFELKKKQQNQVMLFKKMFVIFLIVVVTHNTFTQLNIPTKTYLRSSSSGQ